MDEIKLKVTSRYAVIELSVLIEEMASILIGQILDINWRESKSFGFSSSALSFNNKITLIKDFKNLNKEDVKKLSRLMEIRNKFAHVREVSSFEKLFLQGALGKEIKKTLIGWYADDLDVIESEEKYYNDMFLKLANDVIELFNKLMIESAYERGYKDGSLIIQDKLHDELVMFVIGLKDGDEILKKIKSKIIKQS